MSLRTRVFLKALLIAVLGGATAIPTQLEHRTTASSPQPVRDNYGAPILGPQNVPLEEQNLDLLNPPETDSGEVDNFKWPFSLSHNRLTNGGWARQQNGELILGGCREVLNLTYCSETTPRCDRPGW